MVGALAAGVPIVPVNPKAGTRELEHILERLARPRWCFGARRAGRRRRASGDAGLPAEVDDEAPAIVVYTSGTTGPPKGVLLPRRAIASNLDALADAWDWTGEDVVAHGLPLFHVHGLILGVLGPLRLGGARLASRALLLRGGGRGAGRARDDALRRADDVPPAGGGSRGVLVAGAPRSGRPGCW